MQMYSNVNHYPAGTKWSELFLYNGTSCVQYFHLSHTGLGSLSICEDNSSNAAVPVQNSGPDPGSSPAFDSRPASSFLRVTDLDDTSPLNTCRTDNSKSLNAFLWHEQKTNFLWIFSFTFFYVFWSIFHFWFCVIMSFSWVESEQASASRLLQTLYPTLQVLLSWWGKGSFYSLMDCSS